MVEEASAAAGSLEEQSRALASAVGAFQLGAQHAPAARPAEARRPVEAKHVELKKHVEAKRPGVRKAESHAPAKAVPAKKGNGHLEEGWQEF